MMGSETDLISRGNEFYLQSQYKDAVDCYTKSLSLMQNPEGLFNRSLAYLRLDDFDNSYADINEFLCYNPYDAKGYYIKSLVLSRQGKYSDSLKAVNTALDYNPYLSSAVRHAVIMEATVHQEEAVIGNLPAHEIMIERKGNMITAKSLSASREVIYSQKHVKSIFTGGYWDICLTPLFLRQKIKNTLLLGVCFGSIAHGLTHFTDMMIDAIDPDIDALYDGSKYFGDISDKIIPHKMDGMDYLIKNNSRYDLIILDVFVGDYVPEKFLTDESFDLIKNHLNEQGILVVNYYVLGQPNKYSIIANHLLKRFPSVYTLPWDANRIFLATSNEKTLEELKYILSNTSDNRLQDLGDYLTQIIRKTNPSLSLPVKTRQISMGQRIG